MTTIRSMCPRCGAVDMEPTAVRLLQKDRQYTFVCPVCGDFVVKQADDKIVALLRSVGVLEYTSSSTHPELFDQDAPPLTIDDLIDLHRELEEW